MNKSTSADVDFILYFWLFICLFLILQFQKTCAIKNEPKNIPLCHTRCFRKL